MRHKNDISSIHQGFVVVCIDNRGSLHRGAGWEAYLKGRSPNKKPENHGNAWKSENKAKHISFLLAGWARSSWPTRWRFSTGLPLSLATSTLPGVKVEQQCVCARYISPSWDSITTTISGLVSTVGRTAATSVWWGSYNIPPSSRYEPCNKQLTWETKYSSGLDPHFLLMKGKIRKYNQLKLI